MTGFEPRTSGITSNRSTNWATTTAQEFAMLLICKSTYQASSVSRVINLSKLLEGVEVPEAKARLG